METVTIPRDVYEVLAKAYTSVRQREYADSVAASVRSLTSEELDALPTVMDRSTARRSESTPSVIYYVEEMLRDGTIYEDRNGDHWRWANDTLEVRETSDGRTRFQEYPFWGIAPNMFAPFTPTI